MWQVVYEWGHKSETKAKRRNTVARGKMKNEQSDPGLISEGNTPLLTGGLSCQYYTDDNKRMQLTVNKPDRSLIRFRKPSITAGLLRV